MSLEILKNRRKAMVAMKARERHPKEIAVGLDPKTAAPPPLATHLVARQGAQA
jgi:hypothetical protein